MIIYSMATCDCHVLTGHCTTEKQSSTWTELSYLYLFYLAADFFVLAWVEGSDVLCGGACAVSQETGAEFDW